MNDPIADSVRSILSGHARAHSSNWRPKTIIQRSMSWRGACQRATDIPKLAGADDGVNIKLDKAGGMLEVHLHDRDRELAGE